jgi:rhodanese-related sulfurtransferase
MTYDATLVREHFRAKEAAYISPMGVKTLLDLGAQDVVVVDVRIGPPELLKTKIPGAIEMPAPSVAARWAELPREKLIVLYCWDTWCSLATSVALVLLDKGYRVKELHGGTKAWKTLRLPEEPVAGFGAN